MTSPTTPMAELLPCPFCGFTEIQIAGIMSKEALCMGCGIVGPVSDTRDEAIAAWNTRPALSAQTSEIERLSARIVALEGALGSILMTHDTFDPDAWIDAETRARTALSTPSNLDGPDHE